MEFLEGEALNDLAKRKRLSPEEIADLGATIAEGLGYAHSKGIVHRDVKPGNILVRSDGKPKITDFGIARIEDTAEHLRTQAGEVLGTPAYMAPEQVLSEPVDGRSDIFSLGIILYELCAGERPFRGDSLGAVFQAITQATPVPLSERNPGIPAGLAEAVERCLRRNPAERFQSGEDLAAALRACFRKETPVEAAAKNLPESAKKGTPAWVFAVALAVLAAAGGGIYHFTKGRDAAAPPAAPSVPVAAPKGAAASSLRPLLAFYDFDADASDTSGNHSTITSGCSVLESSRTPTYATAVSSAPQSAAVTPSGSSVAPPASKRNAGRVTSSTPALPSSTDAASERSARSPSTTAASIAVKTGCRYWIIVASASGSLITAKKPQDNAA
jgi:serine/threonine protein kinase